MRVAAAILAAGSGTRFGQDKVLKLLRGKPLWQWSYDVFAGHPRITDIVVVASESNLAEFQARVQPPHRVVAGGSSRPDSSRIAAEATLSSEFLLVHDAARPFLTTELIDRILDSAIEHGASAPFVGVPDTIRQLDSSGATVLDRNRLMAMQTPQAASPAVLRAVWSQCEDATDEAGALEAANVPVAFVAGEPHNFKVTYPADWERARQVAGSETRTGLGYDIHPFSQDPERPLVIGGVRFEGPGLDGHSDADALTHAVVDAVLGAAAMGDIGLHFSNQDPRWKNCDSQHFLAAARELVGAEGWEIVNVDVTVVSELPRVMPKAPQVRAALAASMGIEPGRVNLKATTNEQLGSIGRGEGLAAFAVATLKR